MYFLIRYLNSCGEGWSFRPPLLRIAPKKCSRTSWLRRRVGIYLTSYFFRYLCNNTKALFETRIPFWKIFRLFLLGEMDTDIITLMLCNISFCFSILIPKGSYQFHSHWLTFPISPKMLDDELCTPNQSLINWKNSTVLRALYKSNPNE